MVDLISKAYSLDPANVQGGPPWLEMNHGDVLDRTGLPGSYDFTLSFSSAGQTGGGGAAPPSGDASDPSGALTIFDAVSRQLGLKLEKQKCPVSVLVIDHIDEKPTEN